MIKNSKSILANAMLFSTLMLGNFEQDKTQYIDDDADYESSQLVSYLGGLTFNRAVAGDVEVIQVNGVRGPSGTYEARLRLAIQQAMHGNSGPSDTEHQEEYHTDSEQERVCGPVHDAKPVGCGARPNISPNGCSTDFTSTLDGWSDYFTSSCNLHDICYTKLDSTKKGCDDVMLQNMSYQCNTSPPPGVEAPACRAMARSYYDGVNRAGGIFYAAAQKDSACWVWYSEKHAKRC